MPFDKVATDVDFPAQERAVLKFWERTEAFDRLRQMQRGRPKWSFLDGPITANNPMGVHHAWGRTYKDTFCRFFAMTGHELRYQNGFDCQGLWVEVEVEKELGLETKQDIENLVPGDKFQSIDRFVQLCKQRVDRFAKIQTAQSIRLGYWMDWDREEDWAKPPGQRRSYFTMSDENNYTIWTFLKKCHDRGLIYRAYDAMPWCPRCEVGISQMEMHEGYELVAHRAVFVRFPLRDRPGENLLVWTTTPWTLSSNVAAAVHPELTYVRVRHRDQIYYVAKGALTAPRREEEFQRGEWVRGVPKLKSIAQLFNERGGFEVVGEVYGRDMLGWTYDGPFDELPAQAHKFGYPSGIAQVVEKQQWSAAVAGKEAHRVIAWDQVGETEGTGIVHIAPGCGKEDFELGKVEKLPPIAPLDETGRFLPGFGPLEGRPANDHATTDLILDLLKKSDRLVAVERYPHNYPHCWRCKTELLFRLVDEWYIDMSWRDEIMKICHDIRWIPEFGLQRELDWLRHMGDWMISKKRYWGLALPIWVCGECDRFEVIGSRDELKHRATAGWDRFEGHSPHRPWIDLVEIECRHCGGTARRIADVGNPWLDAGIVPYSTMKYNTDREYWNQWFPADFITECFPGQFRNWFYALLAMSTMMEHRAPFKVLLGHALVRDEHGEEMHKSKGNAIPFDEAAEKMSSDLMRWMFCRHNPVNNINFGYRPADEIRNKFVLKLWNTYAFFCNYARLDGFDPSEPQVPVSERTDLDRWILSDLQLLVRTARREYERYNVQAFCLQAEQFVDSRLSNWYVRRNRRRFWKSEASRDKQAAYQTLYTVLTTLTKLFAPIMPFLSEVMYQNLTQGGSQAIFADRANKPWTEIASVHHCEFPEPDETLIDADLSGDMNALLRIVSLGSAARNKVKIKVRQPLAELRIQSAEPQDRRAVERFADQIRDELNIKRVSIRRPEDGPLVRRVVRANLKSLGPKLGPRLPEVQKALADLDGEIVAGQLGSGQTIDLDIPSGRVTLLPEDVQIDIEPQPGWVAVTEGDLVVAVDTRITPALKQEGLAREIVRHVQNLRKQARLELEDRIVLHLSSTSQELQQALGSFRQYIAGETLATSWADSPIESPAASTDVRIDGQTLHVELRKA